MKRSVVIKRLGYEASAALDNLRYIPRRLFIVSGHLNAIGHLNSAHFAAAARADNRVPDAVAVLLRNRNRSPGRSSRPTAAPVPGIRQCRDGRAASPAAIYDGSAFRASFQTFR